MGEVEAAINLNWAEIVLGIIIAIVAVKFIWSTIEWFIEKLGIEFKGKKKVEEDHNAIAQLSTSINKISEHQDEIINTLNGIKTDVSILKSDVAILKTDVTELKTESEAAKLADQQLLQNVLNEKASRYINELNGVPEDEISSFKNMYKLYKDRGDGDDGLNAKVDYCLKKLDILPVVHKVN